MQGRGRGYNRSGSRGGRGRGYLSGHRANVVVPEEASPGTTHEELKNKTKSTNEKDQEDFSFGHFAHFAYTKKGDEGPGWSTSWKMALWAHLYNSEHAYKMILQLITLVDPKHEVEKEGGLYSNLFTAHPPFQIDANFGFPAALSEMLVQSTRSDLYLLPALPRDKWPHGCVKGLKARGGVTVSISWKEGSLHEALLWSSSSQNSLARLHYGSYAAMISVSPGQVYRFSSDLKCLKTWPL